MEAPRHLESPTIKWYDVIRKPRGNFFLKFADSIVGALHQILLVRRLS